MRDETISRIAVIILAIVLFIFGIYHFQNARDMIGWVPDWVPGGIYWVYAVGIGFILSAIAFVAHRMVKVTGYLLALMLVIFVVSIHLPNYLHSADAEMKQGAMTNILKDLAIAAFALYIGSNAKRI